jgi:hypothetical protein
MDISLKKWLDMSDKQKKEYSDKWLKDHPMVGSIAKLTARFNLNTGRLEFIIQ